MIVVGLDLSLTMTGIACNHDADPMGWLWRVRSKGTKADTLDERAQRLGNLAHRIIGDVTQRLDAVPDLVVVEAPAFAQVSGSHHDRSGLWWLVVEPLCALVCPVVEVPPTTLKKYATGKGNASKDEVLAAIIRRYPMCNPLDNNEADALALMAMGLDHLGEPLADVPAVNRQALDAVHWPQVHRIEDVA